MNANEINPTPKLSRRSRRGIIYRQLKDDLVSFRIPPGRHLSISHLSKSFRSSNTPVREALIRLEAESLVAIDDEGGFRVRDVRLNEMRDLLALARLLLPFCITSATHKFTGGAIAPPAGLLLQSRYRSSSVLRANPTETAHFIEQVFVEIARMSDNASIFKIVGNICDRTHFVRVCDIGEERHDRAFADHLRELWESLRREDHQTAAHTVDQFLQGQAARLPDIVPKALAAVFIQD